MPFVHQVQKEFFTVANFVMVYIEEAHAIDEWPINSGRYNGGKPVCYKQPKSMEDRMKIAADFKINFNPRFPIYCDELTNFFSETYAGWPLRFYIMHNDIIKYIALPENSTYDIGHLRSWLGNYLNIPLEN